MNKKYKKITNLDWPTKCSGNSLCLIFVTINLSDTFFVYLIIFNILFEGDSYYLKNLVSHGLKFCQILNFFFDLYDSIYEDGS